MGFDEHFPAAVTGGWLCARGMGGGRHNERPLLTPTHYAQPSVSWISRSHAFALTTTRLCSIVAGCAFHLLL